MNHRRFAKRFAASTIQSQTALAPYTGTWDRRRAAHLIRRQGFGAAKRDVDQAFNDGTATTATNRLIDDALAEAILRPEALVWYRVSNSTGVQEDYDIQHLWFEAMRWLS